MTRLKSKCSLYNFKKGPLNEYHKYWVSLLNGNKYLCSEYTNHGKGGTFRGFKDLPLNEYPFTTEIGLKREHPIFQCCCICDCI